MQHGSVNAGYGYILRLEKGELLREKLLQFAEKENIKAAYFFGLGSLENVKIGYYDLSDKKYTFTEHSGTY